MTIRLKSNELYPTWSDLVEIDMSDNEIAILRNYEMEDYDTVWDRLCELIEKKYRAIPTDWYIDHIYFN